MNRRRNRELKLILIIVVETIVILWLSCLLLMKNPDFGKWIPHFGRRGVESLDISDINSSYGILIEADNGRVLGEKGSDTVAFPASLTKIMTTIIAIEELSDFNHEITLTYEMLDDLYRQDATRAGFEPEESVRAIDLLYGVMLPSGADCCRALCYDIAGSESAFVELMNQKAEKLGMKNTHFCDSTGLHDPDHYSSARDMATLLQYAMKNETFREILKSPWHSTPATNIHPDGITYYSSLYKGMPDQNVVGGKILGGKTGFTSEAGLCLASTAEIEGKEYILVTMGAWYNGQHFEDAKMIYDRLGTELQK